MLRTARRVSALSDPETVQARSVNSLSELTPPLITLSDRAIGEKGVAAFLRQPGFPFAIALSAVEHSVDRLIEQLLALNGALRIVTAVDGDAVRADHVYVISPGVPWRVEDGRLRLAVPAVRRDDRLERLTVRQRQVLALVLAGESSKRIAAVLSISQRTIENHRAAIMRAAGCRSLPALFRLCMRSEIGSPDVPRAPDCDRSGAVVPERAVATHI